MDSRGGPARTVGSPVKAKLLCFPGAIIARGNAGQAAATIDFIAETLATEREMDRVMPTIEAWAVSGALTRNVHMWRIRKCMHVGRLITRTQSQLE